MKKNWTARAAALVAIFLFIGFEVFFACKASSSDILFPACFAKGIYTVSYDANGGHNAPESQTKNSGVSILLSNKIPERDGYIFVGWSTDKYDETVRFMPGDRFSYDTSLKLYAVWKCATHEHTYVDTVVEPTCTERGYTKHVCTVCNDVKIDSFVQKNGHAAKTEKAVAATCTSPGRKEGLRCTVCGVVIRGLEEVSALGHDIVTSEKAVKPTCTQNGLTAGGYCRRCGYETERSLIPSLGHDIVKDAGKSATCTKDGYTSGEHCTRCEFKTGGEKLPALGHIYVIDEAKSATCTESGLTAGKHCTRCDYKQTRHVIEPLGHKIKRDEEKEPTCTADGCTSGEHCTRCSYRTGAARIPALGHNYRTEKAVAPTCTKSGLTEGRVCTRCSAGTKQKTVAALGHKLVKVAAKSATCTESGLTAGKRCTRCDYKTEGKVVSPLGHSFVADKAKEATCTSDGRTSGKHCTRCSYRTGAARIPALSHNYRTKKAVAPTCTKSGLTEGRACTRCSAGTKQKTVAALGHKLVKDAAISATCTESGLTAGKHCTRCDYKTGGKVVSPLGHSFVADKAKEATCTKDGLTKGEHCKRCGYKTGGKVILKKGHAYVKNVICATMKKDGRIAYRCRFCNAIRGKEQTVPMVKSAVLSKTEFVFSKRAAMPEYVVRDRNGSALKKGRDFTVAYTGNNSTGKAQAKITFCGNYKGEKTLSFRILPAAAKKIKVISITSSSFKATWTKVPGADGYRVFVYKNGRCVRKKDVSRNSVTFKGLDPGCKYTVKVQVYVYIGSSKVFSPNLKSFKTATKAQSPKLSVAAEKRQARLSWSKISGTKNYAVYYSAQKNGDYTKIVSSTNHRVIKKLKPGTRYYFKVIAVKNKNDGPQYAVFSKTVSAVIK